MARASELVERGILSHVERRQPSARVGLAVTHVLLLVALVITGLLPLLWLAKAAVSTTQDTVTDPLALFPSGEIAWGNLADAWTTGRVGQFLLNTAEIAAGTVIATLIVSLTSAYVISVLRPAWGRYFFAAILATLFIPGVISLVPLYLTVVSVPPFGVSLLNTYWAIWLPASANAVVVVIVQRFFDGIPREMFDAARIDGAGAFRVFVLIALPLSRPIIGVVALLTAVNSWKDFLWPLIVISDGSRQPISVALAQSAQSTTLSFQLAGMLLAVLVPIVLFVAFQRSFLRGVSATGGIKG
ncbi:carbohydrate ABC transporter permease [Schumannella luteola]